jgi:chloramphenicol-sensitive protein RarD
VAETRRGFLLGVAAYAIWGLFPLYWPLLEPAGAVEILAHRVFWSLAVVVGLVFAVRRADRLRAVLRSPRIRSILTGAAVVIAINWGTYIWAVNNDHVVEASLGYFINPLVTVLIGVVVLHERLRRAQWAALGLAAVAVLALTIEYGHPPWVALILAFSFGTYGLAKKKANVGAVESLTFETMVLAPVAVAYIAWLVFAGTSTFGHHGAGHALLLAATGVVTVIPLICFGGAATRVSLTTIGLLQYITPTVQFILGVTVFAEPMPAMRWVGFALIWLALALFTGESLRHRHRRRRDLRQLRRAAESAAL